ncbi:MULTISPECIES: hypothetical protein [Actinokineospora]|uniref:hypothetical protein n=1 Tax=Actinokineospora TaxID=39845 RepID=UPI0016705792|nr:MULTISPECIES: hypothetical protein [Actinokineospora]
MTDRTCPHCEGLGLLRWQQAIPTEDGFVLREMEHPCPKGCGGHWRHPAAEADLVIDLGLPGAEEPVHERLVERPE